MLAALTSVILGLAPGPAEADAASDNLADADAPTNEATAGDDEAQSEAETEPEANSVEPEPEPQLESQAPAEPEAGVTPPPGSAPRGGFGQVGEVAIDSQVRALPPSATPGVSGEEAFDDRPPFELSARAEIGFAQTDVGNAAGLDHNGLFLRGHLALVPWISKRRVIGAGIGATYSYVGLNHGVDPELGFELSDSSAQQQTLTFNLEVIVYPHREWFSIQFTPMLVGLGWYAGARLLAADRPARIRSDEYGFATGGSLALCTAWSIACVTGGSQVLFGVRSRGLEAVEFEPTYLRPYNWHVALGVDIAQIVMRIKQGPP